MDGVDLLCIFFCTFGTIHAIDEYVLVEDITSDAFERQRYDDLPVTLELNVKRSVSSNVKLTLSENKRLNYNAPMYEVKSFNGQQFLKKLKTATLKDTKFYHDKENAGSFVVSCQRRSDGACVRRLTGSLELNNVAYEIRPADDTLSTRILDESPLSPHIMTRVSDAARGQRGLSHGGDDDERIPPDQEVNRNYLQVLKALRGRNDPAKPVRTVDIDGDVYLPKERLPDASEKSDHYRVIDDERIPPNIPDDRRQLPMPNGDGVLVEVRLDSNDENRDKDSKVNDDEGESKEKYDIRERKDNDDNIESKDYVDDAESKHIGGYAERKPSDDSWERKESNDDNGEREDESDEDYDKQIKIDFANLKTTLKRLLSVAPEENLRTGRQKRQDKVYAVELVVALDPSVWKNLRYETIDVTELNIYVTVTAFLLYKTVDSTNPLPPSTQILTVDDEERVDGDVYIDAIAPWLSKLSGLPDNDHVMVFTEYDLYSGNVSLNGVLGIAWVGSACKYYRVSINEDTSSLFTTVSVAAHELGHNLGSHHDGNSKYELSAGCPDTSKFIMAPTVHQLIRNDAFTQNPWRFSACSVKQFKAFIQSLDNSGNNCLLDKGDYYNGGEFNTFVSRLPGEQYSADEQCKKVFGNSSRLGCGSTTASPVICQHMLCTTSTTYCYYMTADQGTQCDAPAMNKWCIDGACVQRSSNTNAPTTQPTTTTTRPTTTTTRPITTTTRPTTTTTRPITTTTRRTTTTTRPITTTTRPTTTTTRPITTTTRPTTTTTRPITTTTRPKSCIDESYDGVSCKTLGELLDGLLGYKPSYWCRYDFLQDVCCAYCRDHGISVR
ncbi:hypothetical protein DPMN_123648 [Dreissena polymorpha]|uniref:Peptidase M12B domain-containing protein n=1 Tax=Dreissena polymorpha TaxID=45954 RepID=A0A9D4GUN1_DREPO|nr:hypothetical protein DPMN_123648 [Dreissena polymorpha]